MRKKIIYGSVAGIVLLCAVYFVFLRGDNDDYSLRFDKAAKGSVTVFVTATGTINAVTSVDVGTQVSGIISKLYADFNSIVREGQVIAKIDTTPLMQAVNNAAANLERSRAQFQDAKRTLDRVKMLFEKGLESQAVLDAATTTYETNSASLKQAEVSLQQAKTNLSYATIYAPINGVVIDRKVNVGQTVAASFSSPTLFTIANDLSKMQVQTTVDESDIGRISIGQTATFTVDAYPDDKFTGTVSQVRLAPVTIQNVVNYSVIIDVNNDKLKLMPGMTANVKLLVASAEDVLRVPNMALRLQPPPELIDTSKIAEMRERFGRGGMGVSDSSAGSVRHGESPTGAPRPDAQTAGRPQGERQRGGDAAGQAGNEGRGGRQGGGPGGGWGNPRFQVIRDSIMAKYGSTLDREELRAKMMEAVQKEGLFTGMRSPQQRQAPKAQPSRSANTRFGITNLYPEYQKSTYDPTKEFGRGRVWIQNASGKLEPIMVQTGLNDGKYTQIMTPRLNDGDRIVVGVTSNSADASNQQARSPLAGGPGGGMGGGMGGRGR